eukprot:127488-Pyramimonas_sp.AAC.1
MQQMPQMQAPPAMMQQMPLQATGSDGVSGHTDLKSVVEGITKIMKGYLHGDSAKELDADAELTSLGFNSIDGMEI